MARVAKDGMTTRQRNFAREYHLSGNATQAAIKAQYSEKTAASQGDRLLNNAAVQAELARLGTQAAANYKVTLDKLVAMSYAVHASCMEGQVTLDRYGKPTSTIRRDHAGANKAIENIGRLTGHYVDKSEVAVRSIDAMDDTELANEEAKVEAEIVKLRDVKPD